MKNDPVRRRATCAVVAVSFLAVAVTGVLLLLHVRNGVTFTVHQWMGLVFAVAALGHLVLNGKALVGYLKRPEVRWAVLAAGLVVIGLGIVGATRRPPFHRRGHGGYGQGGSGHGGYGQGGYGQGGSRDSVGSDGSWRGRGHNARHRGDVRRGQRRSLADN